MRKSSNKLMPPIYNSSCYFLSKDKNKSIVKKILDCDDCQLFKYKYINSKSL